MHTKTECAAESFQVKVVNPACWESTTRYHIAVPMVALPPTGWLNAANFQLVSGGVKLVVLLPVATAAIIRLPCFIPFVMVEVKDVTLLPVLVARPWTRVIAI